MLASCSNSNKEPLNFSEHCSSLSQSRGNRNIEHSAFQLPEDAAAEVWEEALISQSFLCPAVLSATVTKAGHCADGSLVLTSLDLHRLALKNIDALCGLCSNDIFQVIRTRTDIDEALSVDLIGDRLLMEQQVAAKFTAYLYLQYVNLDSNSLTTLIALRPLRNLVRISAAHNFLKEDGVFRALGLNTSECESYTDESKLRADIAGMHEQVELMKVKSNIPLTLTSLVLHHNKIDSLSSARLFPNLVELDLRFNRVVCTQADAVACCTHFDVSDMPYLITLLVSYNSIAYVPPEAFRGTSSLRVLDLANNSIGRAPSSVAREQLSASKLAESALQFIGPIASTLRELTLRNNYISHLSCLSALTSIVSIDLSYNNLYDAAQLKHLRKCTTLRVMGLRGNPAFSALGPSCTATTEEALVSQILPTSRKLPALGSRCAREKAQDSLFNSSMSKQAQRESPLCAAPHVARDYTEESKITQYLTSPEMGGEDQEAIVSPQMVSGASGDGTLDADAATIPEDAAVAAEGTFTTQLNKLISTKSILSEFPLPQGDTIGTPFTSMRTMLIAHSEICRSGKDICPVDAEATAADGASPSPCHHIDGTFRNASAESGYDYKNLFDIAAGSSGVHYEYSHPKEDSIFSGNTNRLADRIKSESVKMPFFDVQPDALKSSTVLDLIRRRYPCTNTVPQVKALRTMTTLDALKQLKSLSSAARNMELTSQSFQNSPERAAVTLYKVSHSGRTLVGCGPASSIEKTPESDDEAYIQSMEISVPPPLTQNVTQDRFRTLTSRICDAESACALARSQEGEGSKNQTHLCTAEAMQRLREERHMLLKAIYELPQVCIFDGLVVTSELMTLAQCMVGGEDRDLRQSIKEAVFFKDGGINENVNRTLWNTS